MDLVALAVRLVAVVIWIGGIAFAALVLLPTFSSLSGSVERLANLRGGRRSIVGNEAYSGKQYVSPTMY